MSENTLNPPVDTPDDKPRRRRRYRPRKYQQWTWGQYVEGAIRAIEVSLKLRDQLALSPDDYTRFLRKFATVMRRMKTAKDVDQPFIDRAIAATLAEFGPS